MNIFFGVVTIVFGAVLAIANIVPFVRLFI